MRTTEICANQQNQHIHMYVYHVIETIKNVNRFFVVIATTFALFGYVNWEGKRGGSWENNNVSFIILRKWKINEYLFK